jgi:hypothetical protein
MSQTQNVPTFSTPKISTKNSPVHAVSRHIAPLRDRRSPVAATPRKIKFQNQTPVILEKSLPPYLSPRSPPPRRALAVLQPRALRQSQQTQYLGESAKAPGTAATSLELLLSATTLRAAIPQQTPSAVAIPNHRDIQHVQAPSPLAQAPSPLAQASVRNPLTLQKERTRTCAAHSGT